MLLAEYLSEYKTVFSNTYGVFICSYINGNEAMGTSQYEKAVICFSKAITLQPQQVLSYVGCENESALQSLNKITSDS